MRRRILVALALASCLGCSPPAEPTPPAPVHVYARGQRTCVVLDYTKLRCWGRNTNGQLGFALADEFIGDDEPASTVAPLDLREPITSVAPHTSIACLMLEGGDARCWGGGSLGALGFLWDGWLGDDETLLAGPSLDFGDATLRQISAGLSHTCAVFDDGAVKCWGDGAYGATGYASTEDLGDEPGETPRELPAVELGGPARAVLASSHHSCAIMEQGALRCWGDNSLGKLGLGLDVDDQGQTIHIGDDETPIAVEPIALAGGPVIAVAGQGRQLCALHDAGTVSCWGETGPWLGYGLAMQAVGVAVGDDESPSVLGVVDVGAKVVQLALGDAFSCALLEDGGVKCWGASDVGQLGYGNTDFVGYTETPAEVGRVELGRPAISLTAGRYHACALLDNDELRCWGGADAGCLGHGNTENIGDDETPGQVDPVPFR